jgi:hypothetical protein
MRYDNVNSKKLDTGKTVLEMKIFPTIPKRDDDIYIITQETDRLDTLANQFYNDPSMWWVISHANSLNSADIGVEPGMQLRIPKNIYTVTELFNK